MRSYSNIALVTVFISTLCYAQDTGKRVLRLERRDAPPPPAARVPRGYAVVVGVARYQHPGIAPLQFPETDAEAVYRALISPEAGSFPAENVHRLLGRNATAANIRREIEEWLPSVAQPEDRVIVYFAGHGVVSGGRGYLAPWDIDPSRIEETAYSMQALGNTLANRVKARWKALFADACHAGKINAETTDENVANQLDATASQYLSFTATLGRESSYEFPDLSTGFGLFSYFLVEALRGGADNNPCDGMVTADELVEYVRMNVREYAARKGIMQTPHAGSDYDPAMPMAVAHACGAAGSSPAMSGTVVIETDADKVQLFVDDDLKGIVGRATPLTIPGLATGPHTVKAAKEGYKPEIKQITIIPGIALSVTIRMRFPYAPKRSALQLNESGDKLLRTRRSTLNPMMIIPGIQSQSAGDIRRARDLFTQALREDPDYSEAAYNLGVANQLLRDDAASAAAYRQAIDLDPTYTQARLEYADILISTGDPDGAIRQLTEALRFEPANDEIHARLAGAYWGRSAWNECVAAAGQALTLNSRNFSAHFRRGDCLRQLAVAEPAAARKASLFSQARESYQTFVTLTNYSTPALSWVAFHFLGTGLGRRVHADRKDTYKVWRNEGYLGLCICEKALGNLLRARGHCARATDYLPDDAMSYFFLGNVNRDLFITTKACEYVAHSRLAYQKMLSLNPNLAEAKNARFYLDQFDGMRQALRQRGCT